MPSSRMLRCAAVVITDVSEERSASIIRVTRIGELGTTVAVARNEDMHHLGCIFFLDLSITSVVPEQIIFYIPSHKSHFQDPRRKRCIEVSLYL
jgi:hypothetical protein